VFIEWLAIFLLSSALATLLTFANWTGRADNIIYDALAKVAAHGAGDDIVIVGIDNRSIEALGRYPWPRQVHAQLLQGLARMRPKAIAYDVLFVDPDPATDGALAAAVRGAAPTYLPLLIEVPGPDGTPYRVLPPVPPIAQAAAGLGHVGVAPDEDGVVRRAFLEASDGSRSWPHLMSLMHGAPLPAPTRQVGQGLQLTHPTMISFAGPAGSFRTISAVDVIRGETPPDFLKGKLVLVGSTADGLGDQYATPLSDGASAMSGVELQANILNTLNQGQAVRPVGLPWTLVFAVAPLWLLLAGFLSLPPRANMVLGGVLFTAALTASAVLCLDARLWLPPTTTLTVLMLVYPLWSWRRLAASAAYLEDELKQFAEEPDVLSVLSGPPGALPGDLIERNVVLMRRAIARARDLRAFVTDGLHGLPDPVLLASADERVVVANRAALDLFRSTASPPVEGSDLGALMAGFKEAEPGNPAPPSPASGPQHSELVAPDGRIFNVSRIPVQGSSGRTAAWIVRLTDITSIKAAAKQREDVLQLLTHDMRSPQVSILSLLARRQAQPLAAELSARIEAYARRTLALADDFVRLARAEGADYELETLNLGDLVQFAVDDVWPQSSAKGVAVAVQEVETEFLVEAERSLLLRALINLLDNAVKFTEPGGRVDCSLRSRCDASRREVQCVIADTGPGMTAAQRARIFERFRRGVSARAGDGAGLGLAFVQTVATRHGGAIDCQSDPGEGSVFTLTLPLSGRGAS
jgi:CHASE2 domain-containing sensor protein/two-component sensor histidine kinase